MSVFLELLLHIVMIYHKLILCLVDVASLTFIESILLFCVYILLVVRCVTENGCVQYVVVGFYLLNSIFWCLHF